MNTKRAGVGIIGCGNISDIYFQNCRAFEILEVVACADLIPDRAKEKAEKNTASPPRAPANGPHLSQ